MELPFCPQCSNSDSVKNVSDAVLEVFPSEQHIGTEPISWVGRIYYVPTSRFSLTKPIEKLLPIIKQPQTPPSAIAKTLYFNYVWVIFWFILICIGIVNTIIVLIILGTILVTLSTLSIILLTIVKYYMNKMFVEERAIYTQKLGNLEEAESKWSALYYCYRDEALFTLEGDKINIDELNTYLFGRT